MAQTIKRILFSSAIASLFLLPLAFAAPASAQFGCDDGSIEANLNCSVQQVDDSEGSAEDRVNNIVKTVINIFSVVVGIVAVIMIIIGGLKYITSSGESSNVSGAKNTILYAIVGLIIVALAQIIVRFVLERAAGN